MQVFACWYYFTYDNLSEEAAKEYQNGLQETFGHLKNLDRKSQKAKLIVLIEELKSDSEIIEDPRTELI